MTRSYAIRTFGCQMNEHDSERIAGLLEADGLERVDDPETADVIVLNTCCIRENADNRLYGHLGQLKQLKDAKPGKMLVVGGCAAQKDRDLVRERAPWVSAPPKQARTFLISFVQQAREIVRRRVSSA